MGTRNGKTELKIEGTTFYRKDVLFLCDVRLNNGINEINRYFGLNRNCSYKCYWNSTRENRGVGILIKRNIVHQVHELYKSDDENVILMKITIKGATLILGSIYGPNEQKPEFVKTLREKIESWGLPFIIGGDYNTILDNSKGAENLDREDGGARGIPNNKNSAEINKWINEV